MKFLLHFFSNHWQRKVMSLTLAISIWFSVNQSLISTKTLDNVAVRLVNIPAGMIVDGLLVSGLLSQRVSLSVQGNEKHLKELTSNDLEVVLDATDKPQHWVANIARKNLVSLNPDVNLSKAVKRLTIQQIPIALTKLVTEKIPVIVNRPVGEAPRDYQFLDVWPYQLSMTVSGPEEKIKQVKAKGISLTFNLNDIKREDLEKAETISDTVSLKVPDAWKQVELPFLAEHPFIIDDPQAQKMQIDFVKSDLHPIAKPVLVSLFFPTDHALQINPELYSISPSELIEKFRGLYMIRKPLFVKGTSRLFAELVQDMFQISVIVRPPGEPMSWCIQFQNRQLLEDRYVSLLLSDEEHHNLGHSAVVKAREKYLRNRFRNYMHRFQLFKSSTEPLRFTIESSDNLIYLEDVSHEKTRSY